MTLLTTEIVPGAFPAIVFAADRRISVAGRRQADRSKILTLPGKRAGIGYFGLAELPFKGPQRHMDVWLSDFLRAHSALHTLRETAEALVARLNQVVPAPHQRKHVSGFHLAGLASDGQPEFWFVRNVKDDRSTLIGHYSAREDFQRRDLRRLTHAAVQIYRNGDLRAHAAAWEQLDQSFQGLLTTPGFRIGKGPVAHMRWVQFKLETIAHFYQRFSSESIIGKPVDAFVITSAGVKHSTSRRHK